MSVYCFSVSQSQGCLHGECCMARTAAQWVPSQPPLLFVSTHCLRGKEVDDERRLASGDSYLQLLAVDFVNLRAGAEGGTRKGWGRVVRLLLWLREG